MRPDPVRLSELPGRVAWSNPSDYQHTGVHHGYRQHTVVNGGHVADKWRWLVDQFAPVRSAWLSWIEPGGFVVCHIDAGPHYERWQLPITGFGSLNGERAEPGVPFQVHHDRWHHVRNDDAHPRVVLVVDRDVVISPERSPFQICPGGISCRSQHSE